MTLHVYRVGRDGVVTEDRGTVYVQDGETPPPVRDVHPECRCPSHRAGQAARAPVNPVSGVRRTDAAVPLDLGTMRATVRSLVNPDGSPTDPAPDEAESAATTDVLRGHLELLIPAVETAAGELPDSIARYCALACVGEARGKLRAEPLPRPGGALAYARRLARVLSALCDHHERLDGKSDD